MSVWYTEHGHDEGVLEAGERADSEFAVLEQPSPRPNSIGDLDSLVAELGRVRDRGCATSGEELERGVVAASAPVYDFTSRIVAALNVSAPKERIGAQPDKLGRIVAGAARDLSAALGYPA